MTVGLMNAIIVEIRSVPGGRMEDKRMDSDRPTIEADKKLYKINQGRCYCITQGKDKNFQLFFHDQSTGRKLLVIPSPPHKQNNADIVQAVRSKAIDLMVKGSTSTQIFALDELVKHYAVTKACLKKHYIGDGESPEWHDLWIQANSKRQHCACCDQLVLCTFDSLSLCLFSSNGCPCLEKKAS